jgi:hypothetical protein
VGLKPSASQGEARLRGLALTIGVNPFSRVDFSGEMSDLLYPVRLPPHPPNPLLPQGEKGETGRCTPHPPNPLLPHGEKGSLGILMPETRDETPKRARRPALLPQSKGDGGGGGAPT